MSRLAGTPGAFDERARGAGDGDDELSGNAAANRLQGMRGSDVLQGRGGDDVLDGGAGLDIAVYAGARAGYAVGRGGSGWSVVDGRGSDGTDTLQGIERLRFADTHLAIDVAPDGRAMQAARVVYTLFGSAWLQPHVVGIALSYLDAGSSESVLLRAALESDAFATLAGSRSNRDFVRQVWTSVVGSAPDAASLATYTALLDSGAYTQLALAELASRDPIVTLSAALVGVAEHGIEYVPVG